METGGDRWRQVTGGDRVETGDRWRQVTSGDRWRRGAAALYLLAVLFYSPVPHTL